MTEGLSARQIKILKTLVDEYIETAEPVGSETLDKKFNLGVSSATIRNEMVKLTNLNYLKQPHTSSGRVPTPKGMKFYINQLMEEEQMSLTDEVKVREEVWDSRANMENLLCDVVTSLAHKTNSIAIATLDGGKRIWHSGYANVFLNPEFADLELIANLFGFLEETQRMNDLFFNKMTGASLVEVLFGEELGWPEIESTGVVGTRFKAHGKEGALGIIGPARLSYSTVIPIMRYYKKLIEEVTR